MKILKSSIMGVIAGFLGAWAGCDNTSKNWRRFLIPFALTGLAFGHLQSFWVLTIMFISIGFSIGYGIPDETDEGSALARFWVKIIDKVIWRIFPQIWTPERIDILLNILTRGTIALMVNLSLLSIPILKGNWLIYYIGASSIKLVYTTCSWRDLGGFRIKGKYLLISDVITYGIIGIVTSAMIYF